MKRHDLLRCSVLINALHNHKSVFFCVTIPLETMDIGICVLYIDQSNLYVKGLKQAHIL